MKKLWFVLLIFMLLLAACSPAVVPTVAVIKPMSNKDYQKGKPFRMVISPRTHPVHQLMVYGFHKACKDLDLLCDDSLLLDTVTLDQYTAAMESAVSLGSSGVIMNMGAPVIYKPGETITAAGIPLVSAHGQIPAGTIKGLTAWVAADSVEFAKRAAAEMAKAVNCVGPVANNQNGHSDQEDAVGNTFKAELIRLCPGIVVLQTQMEGVEPTVATAVDAAIIAANPKLTGAFSTTGGGPTSWSNALKEAGKKPGDVKVISMDYSLENLTLLKQGWAYALVCQPLVDEFYKGVELMLAKLKGEAVPYDNPLPAPIIHQADADAYIAINNAAGNK